MFHPERSILATSGPPRVVDPLSGVSLSTSRHPVVGFFRASIDVYDCIDENGKFDLAVVAKNMEVTFNMLNAAIGITAYPNSSLATFIMEERPLAISLHGMARALQAMSLPYGSVDARRLNTAIMERAYFFSLALSCTRARRLQTSFKSCGESITGIGMFQTGFHPHVSSQESLPWSQLQSDVALYGTTNSVSIGLMEDPACDLWTCDYGLGPSTR